MMLTSNLLKGKVVLVTGCNRGIGREIAKTFAINGAIVYANARKEGSLVNLLNELPKELNENLIPVYFDVTDTSSVKQVFMMINKEHKRLDCLVNNAGIMQDALIGMATEKNMNETFNVNVFAVINLIQYATKLMKRQRSGSIINISSVVGVNGNPGQIIYSASKGAVITLTKSAAKELAEYSIRVNAIAPGVIETDLTADINQQKMDLINSKIGMGRMGKANDVANLALFLSSDLSEYITGQTICIDGSLVI